MAADLSKEIKAAQDDEQVNQQRLETFVSYTHRRLKIPVRDAGASDRFVEILARKFEDAEIFEFKRRLRDINPKLLEIRREDEPPVNSTPEEDEAVCKLYGEFVGRVTGYSAEQIRKLGIRAVSYVFTKTWAESNPSEKDLADVIDKFRPKQRGLPAG